MSKVKTSESQLTRSYREQRLCVGLKIPTWNTTTLACCPFSPPPPKSHKCLPISDTCGFSPDYESQENETFNSSIVINHQYQPNPKGCNTRHPPCCIVLYLLVWHRGCPWPEKTARLHGPPLIQFSQLWETQFLELLCPQLHPKLLMRKTPSRQHITSEPLLQSWPPKSWWGLNTELAFFYFSPSCCQQQLWDPAAEVSSAGPFQGVRPNETGMVASA